MKKGRGAARWDKAPKSCRATRLSALVGTDVLGGPKSKSEKVTGTVILSGARINARVVEPVGRHAVSGSDCPFALDDALIRTAEDVGPYNATLRYPKWEAWVKLAFCE